MGMSGRKRWLAVALTIVALGVLLGYFRGVFVESRKTVAGNTSLESPNFVDERQCGACHAEQFSVWQSSHHALAMQTVTPDSVLGDFNDRDFSGSGSSAHFSHPKNSEYIVNTEDADGVKKDFPVQYVFGVSPLQQYLLALPRGRLQALSIAWDVQQKKWFHLYPNETIKPNDPLHWTQPAQNWNFMCAECHSTDLKKNYDPLNDSYATSWFQINVGCQACHGPASNHLRWTQASGERAIFGAQKGFVVDLSSADSTVQIEACARCHSRRSVIAPHYEYGKRLLDFYRPALLDESLYYADGQQQDEVYEYGSFVQSKMAHKGLRCSDCHNPHSARPRIEGNALCASCHNARGVILRSGIDGSGLQKKNYDSAEHHFHTPGQSGSHCIECHAPAKNYMVIDARIDHSFRIPRPDLTLKIGTPNACNRCHSDKSPQWALAQIQKHHPDFSTAWHYGEALAAGRDAKAGAVARLREVIADKQYAAIVRASALRLLRRYPGALSADLLQSTLQDADPIVRVTAVESFSDIPIEERQRWLSPLLHDSVRAVRIEAARALAGLQAQAVDGLAAAIDELEASYTTNFDRPESRVGLADLRVAQARYPEAETIYRETLRLWPGSIETMVNLAELYRLQGRENEVELVLRQAFARQPENPVVLQSLAFSLIRQQRKNEAMMLLERSAKSSSNVEIAYLFGIALLDDGQTKRGFSVLEKALARAPGNRDVLLALASHAASVGDSETAQRYLQKLAAINPLDPALQQ